MRKHAGFYFFVILAISFAGVSIWYSKRTPSPSVSVDPIGNYESIPIRTDSFELKFKSYLVGIIPSNRVSYDPARSGALEISIVEGNLLRHFNIKDSAKFYQRWPSIRFDSASSTLKMRLDVKEGMVDVPAQLAFSIFK